MRKCYTSAFKAQLVAQALKEEKTLTQIASENDIHPKQISACKAKYCRDERSIRRTNGKIMRDFGRSDCKAVSPFQNDERANSF